LAKVFSQLSDWRQKGDYSDFLDFDRERTMPLFEPVEVLIKAIEDLSV
jgi:hypothetical protein